MAENGDQGWATGEQARGMLGAWGQVQDSGGDDAIDGDFYGQGAPPTMQERWAPFMRQNPYFQGFGPETSQRDLQGWFGQTYSNQPQMGTTMRPGQYQAHQNWQQSKMNLWRQQYQRYWQEYQQYLMLAQQEWARNAGLDNYITDPMVAPAPTTNAISNTISGPTTGQRADPYGGQKVKPGDPRLKTEKQTPYTQTPKDPMGGITATAISFNPQPQLPTGGGIADNQFKWYGR